MKPRLGILGLLAVTLVLLAGAAVLGGHAPGPLVSARQPPAALPTVPPAPVLTGGWWDQVSLTPPPLAPLPGLPAVSLGQPAGGASGGPVPFSVISCPQDLVKITGIATAKSGWWNVTGTAASPNLGYWKTELSADGQGWTLLYKHSTPVQDGLLMEFNTRTVPQGTYQLRLLAVDATGNYGAPCTVQITTQ